MKIDPKVREVLTRPSTTLMGISIAADFAAARYARRHFGAQGRRLVWLVLFAANAKHAEVRQRDAEQRARSLQEDRDRVEAARRRRARNGGAA